MTRRELTLIPEGTTEEKLIELWVRLKKSQHTQRAYRRDIQVFRDVVEKPLIAVTLEDALDFHDLLDELEVKTRGGEVKVLEDNSKRRILNSVKSFYSFAHTTGLFPTNVMASIKPPSAKSAISQRILSEADVLRMILLEQSPRNSAILHTLYAGGLRVSELCKLQWRHVIRRQVGVQLDIMSGKGDKQRHVLLPEGSWKVLSRLRAEAIKGHVWIRQPCSASCARRPSGQALRTGTRSHRTGSDTATVLTPLTDKHLSRSCVTP